MEVYPYVDEQINLLVHDIKNEISTIPPELLADAADHGIKICGGGSLIFDIADRLSNQLGIRCECVNEPMQAKIRGIGKLMLDNDLLENNGYHFIFKDEIKNKIQ